MKFNLKSCPLALQDNKINVKHHLEAIKEAGLGPANPLEKNDAFWKEKAKDWGTTEGDARGRLCNNCEYYFDTPDIRDCISNGPALSLKASALPLTPKWTDIESHPIGYCSMWDITCSPIRTCDEQEIYQRPDEVTYEDPFKSTLEDTTK